MDLLPAACIGVPRAPVNLGVRQQLLLCMMFYSQTQGLPGALSFCRHVSV